MPTPDRHLIPDPVAAPTAELLASDVDVVHLLGLPLPLDMVARRLGTIARFAAVDADAGLGLVTRHDGPPTT